MSFILGLVVYVVVLGRMDARLPWQQQRVPAVTS
jgi:hypothetical protein